MNSNESAKCFTNEIRKRWPRWTPSDVEISDWLEWFSKYDYATIVQAARKHLAESRYAKPIPCQLLEHAKSIRARISPQRCKSKLRSQDTGVPEAHTYIMCVGTDDNGRGCVGWFVPVLIWPFHKTYTAEAYRRTAEQQCALHARRGGIWEIFTNTTHGEMLTRRLKLTHAKPFDLNSLRKRKTLNAKGT